MGAAARPDGRQPIAITAEAAAKIVAYAKGDAEWAADLEAAALAIAEQQALPAVDAAAVKAALLQIWTSRRQLPRSAARATSEAVRDVSVPPESPPPESPLAGRQPPAWQPGVSVAPAAPAQRQPATEPDEVEPRVELTAVPAAPGDKAPRLWSVGCVSGEAGLTATAIGLIIAVLLFPGSDPPPEPALPAIEAFHPVPPAAPSSPSPQPAGENAVQQAPADGAAERPAATPLADAPEPSAAAAIVPSPAVRDGQRLLRRLGYDPGPADGVPGPATAAAVRAFGRDTGIGGDGTVTPQVLAALRERVKVTAPSETAHRAAPSGDARSFERRAAEELSAVGDWLGAVARNVGSSLSNVGRGYDSRARPGELAAHCRAVPDDHVFDAATGRLVSCARIVGSNDKAPGSHAP